MMTQSHSVRGAGLEDTRPLFSPAVTPPRDRLSATDHAPPGPTSDLTVSALDRLIACFESGTATPEDIDGLPAWIVEYLHAALTLDDMGVSGADWEVTPTGGILVRGTHC